MGFRTVGPLDEPQIAAGDNQFIGVDSYNSAENLAPGMAQAAVNIDFSKGDAEPRGAFLCIPELGNAPFDAAADWTTRTPAANLQWQAVVHGNGLFVAVADSGTGNRVMTSPDGTTWTSRTSAADLTWEDVCFGNGLFVAVASSGTGNRVMTSTNGITWTSRTSAADIQWRSVVWGEAAGLFVAVADTGTTQQVMTSPDGVTWTIRTSVGSGKSWRHVTYDGTTFVAVGSGGGLSEAMTSTNGTSWTLRTTVGAGNWIGLAYGNNTFVATGLTGQVMTSADSGVTWVLRTAAEANSWDALCFGNGIFVAVASSGTNRVQTSPDGITWTAQSAANASGWAGITNARNTFVAVADDGGSDDVMTAGATSAVFAKGKYSNPNDIGQEYTMLVGRDSVGFYGFGHTTKTVPYASGETVTQQATIVQANNQVFIFRGPDEVPLMWNGKWAAPFQEATGTIPNATFALYAQDRLWAIVGKDSLYASDALAFTTFTQITSQFHISPGDSNHLVTAYPFGDDAIVVFKNRSILLLQGVSGSLSDVDAVEITRQVGAVGINAVTSVGPDLVYVSDRNINLLSLTTTNNSVQHKILPLSAPIQKIFDRVNWEYGYKISVGYWDNKLYVALPLDNATVCSSIVVHNFVTGQWFGEWNFNSSLGMAILGFEVAPYLGLQRLQLITEDGKIFVLTDGYYDLMGTVQAHIETGLTTRAYPIDNKIRDGGTFYMDISTSNPKFSVTASSSGQGHTSALVTDREYARSSTWKAGDTSYNLTNSGDDYNRPWRKDYAWTVSENVQMQSGILPMALQQVRVPLRFLLRGRTVQFEITNTTGHLQVNGIGVEAEGGANITTTLAG